MKLIAVDHKILTFIAQNPGANIGKASKHLLSEYSGAYVRDRIHTLIANGLLIAEINEVGRYRIFVVEEKTLEA